MMSVTLSDISSKGKRLFSLKSVELSSSESSKLISYDSYSCYNFLGFVKLLSNSVQAQKPSRSNNNENTVQSSFMKAVMV